MLFLKKKPDTIDLQHGTLEVNGFMLDGWTTDEMFLRNFGDAAAPHKKQATYVLNDTMVRLNDIEFTSILVQFSPLGLQGQRVAENITLYLQPCKHSDFIKRIAAKLPHVKPDVCNDYDYVAVHSGLRVTARVDTSNMMASLNLEYLDSASRVDNWVRDGCWDIVTPKSGAIMINNQVYHANLRENVFKRELLPTLPAPEECAMDENIMTYTFKDVLFYDIRGNVQFGFMDNKLASLQVISIESEEVYEWAKKMFGTPMGEEGEYYAYIVRAAGNREWRIRVYKQQPRMEFRLKSAQHI